MDGNRGAKGSIKDRLISLLYRIRYLKIIKSKYTIEEKKKQKKYLEDLKRFREVSNYNILDLEDIDILDNIKITGIYKVEDKDSYKLSNSKLYENKSLDVTNKSIIYYNQSKSINLESLTLDSKITKEVLDFDKEESKIKDEIIIIKEITKFVDNTKKELSEIENKIDFLSDKVKIDNVDNSLYEKEYIELQNKVRKLKDEYDSIKEKYDLSEFKIFKSITLINAISDYKKKSSLNEMKMLVNVCKTEINKIKKIEISYKKTNKIKTDIEKVNNTQTNVKIKFTLEKKYLEELQRKNEKIKEILELNQKKVLELLNKASYIEVTKKIESSYTSFGKVINGMMKFIGGVITIPLSFKNIFGIALGSTLINRGLKSINKGLELKQKIVYNYDYEDISKKVMQVEDKVNYTSSIINDSLSEISKMKDNIKNTYSKYSIILDEYNPVFNNINKLEKILIRQKEQINNLNKNIKKEKELNDVKMQKIKKLKSNN